MMDFFAYEIYRTVSTVSQNLIEAIISKQAGAVPTNSRTNSLPASPTRNFELEVRSPEIPDAIASDENEEQSEAVIDEVLDQDDEEDSGQGSSSFTGMVFTKKRSIPKSNNIWNISERENPLSQGYEVAALVDEHSDPNLWILAKVLKYDVVRDRYRVLDADTADGQNK